MTKNLILAGVAAMLAGIATPALAIFAGGGNPASDCYAVFDGVEGSSSRISCADGDPCDADGTPDGVCTFNISVCAFQAIEGCTPQAVATYKGSWVKKGYPLPATGVTTSTCGSPQQFTLQTRKTRRGKILASKPTRLKLVAKAAAGSPRADTDKLTLICTPAPPSCPANPAGGPNQLTMTVAPSGSDLDTGESGKSHNFIVPSGSQLKYCLSGCDTSTTSLCQASGETGAGKLNGPTFGPPLPLFSSNVAVCVVNRYADPTVTATMDIATGKFDASTTPVNLLADTYQGTATKVCPRCVQGKCDDASRNPGAPCTVDGTVVVNNPPTIVNAQYPVSRDCLPSGSPLGTPTVALNLTTEMATLQGNAAGTFPCPGQVRHDECGGATCNVDCSASSDFKGGKQQVCCANPQSTPCFPTAPSSGIGKIERQGNPVVVQPAWPDPTYPKRAEGGILAATFCIPSTTAPLVDGTAGLPGPGALLLPGTIVFTKPAQ